MNQDSAKRWGIDYEALGPEQKITRPNYQALKDSPTNNEVAFLMCLIGFATMNPLHSVDGFEGNFNIFEIRENIEFHKGLKAGLDFAGVLVNIKRIIEIGVAGKKIIRVEIKYSSPPAPIHGPFRVDFYYDTLPFLRWMKQNFVPIPDELAFDEKDDGTLYWLEKDKKSPEEKLNIFFAAVGIEVESLYGGIKYEVGHKKIQGMFNATIDDALNAYKNHEPFKHILLEDIRESEKGFGIENPHREIKGRILLNAAKRMLKDMFINKTIPTNPQAMHEKYMLFKKQSKK